MPLHAQAERLEALGEQPSIEGSDGRAQVAEQLHARLEDEGQVGAECRADAEVTCIDQAVVAGVGLVVVREALGILGIVEVAGVDDRSRDRRAVTADVLRRRVHDDVGAPLDRTDQVGGGDGVVDDEGDADLVSESGDPLDVEDVVLGIGDRLAVERLGIGADRGTPGLKIIGILDEADLDTELGQGVVEEVVRPAVEARAGDNVIARLRDVENCQRLCRLAA